MKSIFISAHPDDETLGCGGTILKEKAKGNSIAWLNITNIFSDQGFTKERIDSRQEEIKQVGNMYGFDKIYNLNIPTMSLDTSTLPLLIKKISEVFEDFKPNSIYVTNRSDAHSDHRYLFDAVAACTKSFRYPYIKKVLMYECISETEFAPALFEKVFIQNYYVDITNHIEKKIEIMKIYESELGEHPFPRSIENINALASFRGASCGVKFAEAFQLLKYIDK